MRREICAWAWTAVLVLAVVIVGCVAAAALAAVLRGQSPTAELVGGIGALLAVLRRDAPA